MYTLNKRLKSYTGLQSSYMRVAPVDVLYRPPAQPVFQSMLKFFRNFHIINPKLILRGM